MTAEQALIEENKKDPRVRYITQDEENNTYVWIDKPIHIISALNYWNGFYAKKIDFQVDFNTEKSEDCILCIDDIKQEIPPITEKWYIEFTENNFMFLDSWRRKKASKFLKVTFLEKCFLLSDDYFNDGSFYVGIDESIPEGYEKITLEQFKKYVLKEEPEESEKIQAEIQESASEPSPAEKTIENHIIMNIAESEREQSQKEQEETRPTKTLYPRRMWIEDRLNAINQSVKSYIDNDYCIPTDWIEERNELIETLNNL